MEKEQNLKKKKECTIGKNQQNWKTDRPIKSDQEKLHAN